MSAGKKSYKVVSQRTSSELVDVLESGETSTAGKTQLRSSDISLSSTLKILADRITHLNILFISV